MSGNTARSDGDILSDGRTKGLIVVLRRVSFWWRRCALLDVADPTRRYNRLFVGSLVLPVLGVWMAFRAAPEAGGESFGFILALASLMASAVLGFLFGIPRAVQRDEASISDET